jgi:hypothetical protein
MSAQFLLIPCSECEAYDRDHDEKCWLHPDHDPTPWCHCCGAKTREGCDCDRVKDQSLLAEEYESRRDDDTYWEASRVTGERF